MGSIQDERSFAGAHAYAGFRVPADCKNVMIDRMECVRCGVCWNTCPALFDQNSCDSFSQVFGGVPVQR